MDRPSESLARLLSELINDGRIAATDHLRQVSELARACLKSADNPRAAVAYALWRFCEEAADDRDARAIPQYCAEAFAGRVAPVLTRAATFLEYGGAPEGGCAIVAAIARVHAELLPA